MTFKQGVVALLLGSLLGLSGQAMAAQDKDVFKLPPNAVFRYIDNSGKTVVSSMLTEEALYAGYQILNSRGRVVKIVPPGIPKAERAAIRAQRKQELHDQKLLRMYATPDGAVRTRNRQIQSIQLKISYAQNNLTREQAKLQQQISRAANFQKRGQEVPDGVKDLIDLYHGQVTETQDNLADYQAKIKAIQSRFAKVISRLEMLTGDKVSQDLQAHTTTENGAASN